jgi:hypothetical protein
MLRTLPLSPAGWWPPRLRPPPFTASIASLALLTLGEALLWFSGDLPLARGYFLLACLGALLVVPAVITLGVTVQCAIALAFPAWVHLGRSRPGGIEAMGQNILTLAASAVLIALLLPPPALTGALMAAFLWGQWGPLAPALGGLAAVAMAYAEVVLAAGALGRLFDRTDPAAAGITG